MGLPVPIPTRKSGQFFSGRIPLIDQRVDALVKENKLLNPQPRVSSANRSGYNAIPSNYLTFNLLNTQEDDQGVACKDL